MIPSDFRPVTPRDLIGEAGRLATALLAHTAKAKHDDALIKVLLYGPGTGKTTIADMIAATLANQKFDIESINGRDLTIEVVRDWRRDNCYGALSGGWKVKVINELDLAPMAAQDLMLSYLDELAPRTAVIGTSNESFETLSARFKSRFQSIKIPAPSQSQLSRWLKRKFGLARQGADWIAATCCGNVRQALLEATSLLTLGVLPDKSVATPAPAKCAARSDAAQRAWETMRARKAVAV